MKVNSICIVGGGSSGWMTAAALSKNFHDIDITLVESDKKPVGVGESTLARFNMFLDFLGLQDEDWMKYCNATYKTSIAFKNFRKGEGERFQYPFGQSIKDKTSNLYYYLPHHYPELYPPEEGARFFNRQTLLAESNRFSKKNIEGLCFNHEKDSAYHFDAELFGEFLKEKVAIPNGVNHIKDEVLHAVKDRYGNIIYLHTKNNINLKADLYIDCTGFKSLLLEKFMGVPFVSFKEYLFNDTAIIANIPYINKNKQLRTWTDCVAMDNGWAWEIPLWNRIGVGYVFSKNYTSIKEATKEFKSYISKVYSNEIGEQVKFKVINIKHGKHIKAWENNVVGVGLSYGFIEPLESTGLLTTHENILKLIDVLENNNKFISQRDKDEFNYSINSLIDVMMIFVTEHYYLSSRCDTQYWRDCINNKSLYDNRLKGLKSIFDKALNHQIDSYLGKNINEWWDFNHNTGGSIYLALGQGINPITKRVYNHHSSFLGFEKTIEELHRKYQHEKENLLTILNTLPTHYEFLKNNIYV